MKLLNLRTATVCAFGMTRRKGIEASDDPGMLALLRSEAPVCTVVGKTWDFHVEMVRSQPPSLPPCANRHSLTDFLTVPLSFSNSHSLTVSLALHHHTTTTTLKTHHPPACLAA